MCCMSAEAKVSVGSEVVQEKCTVNYNVSSCLRLPFSMTGPFSSVKRVTLIHHIPNHHKKGKSIYSSFNETIYMT